MTPTNKTTAAATGIGYAVGILPESVRTKTLAFMPSFDMSTQNEITFWLQTAAFIITILVGVLSIINWFRKNKKEKSHV
jgi:hypothetical protein